MHEERITLAGVPTRVYDPGGSRGLLLLGHGGGHSKDGARFVRFCRRYAEALGLAVVCIDAVDHGERRPAAAGVDVPHGWHSGASPQMVDDWKRVVDELSTLGPAVAYVGFSMGAIFGFATVAAIPSIRAAVFVAGGIPGGQWTQDPDLEPLLLGAAGRLSGADVLMLNMEEDELFDADGVRRLFDGVGARSKALTFFPGMHDEWEPDVIDASLYFLGEHVGGDLR